MTTEENIHVPPQSADEFVEQKPADLIADATKFLREHWSEVRKFYAALAGVEPSIHGSTNLDEAACVFKIRDIASDNGFKAFDGVQTEKLRVAFRRAYKRNTGKSVNFLVEQNRLLRIEDKAPQAAE